MTTILEILNTPEYTHEKAKSFVMHEVCIGSSSSLALFNFGSNSERVWGGGGVSWPENSMLFTFLGYCCISVIIIVSASGVGGGL